MANLITHKKSSVAGKVPVVSDLSLGELAVNTYDGYLYLKKNVSGTETVIKIGPDTPTEVLNKLITVDGTGSGLDADLLDGMHASTASAVNTVVARDANANINVNSTNFNTSIVTAPTTPGSLFWDTADGNQTLSLVMAGGATIQQIGEEQYYRVKASTAITNGQVVMFSGTVGNSGAVTGAPATGLTPATASYIIGVATQDIALNEWGYVTSFGLVRNVDTSAFTDGAILYLNPAVVGGLTTTIPAAPAPKVQVGACISAAVNGAIFVRPSIGGSLGMFEGDVSVVAPSSGNTLIYDAIAGTWENANISGSTNVTVTNGAGTITISLPSTISSNTSGNAATATVLQTARTINGVSFNGSANITVTASTTNALTINNGLSGTSFNGSAAVSIGLATAYGDTINPYASKTAKTFLAAPNATNGIPSFRTIVASDIPTLNQNTTGTAANVTGTVAIANGGTGATTVSQAQTNLQVDPAGTAFLMALIYG